MKPMMYRPNDDTYVPLPKFVINGKITKRPTNTYSTKTLPSFTPSSQSLYYSKSHHPHTGKVELDDENSLFFNNSNGDILRHDPTTWNTLPDNSFNETWNQHVFANPIQDFWEYDGTNGFSHNFDQESYNISCEIHTSPEEQTFTYSEPHFPNTHSYPSNEFTTTSYDNPHDLMGRSYNPNLTDYTEYWESDPLNEEKIEETSIPNASKMTSAYPSISHTNQSNIEDDDFENKSETVSFSPVYLEQDLTLSEPLCNSYVETEAIISTDNPRIANYHTLPVESISSADNLRIADYHTLPTEGISLTDNLRTAHYHILPTGSISSTDNLRIADYHTLPAEDLSSTDNLRTANYHTQPTRSISSTDNLRIADYHTLPTEDISSTDNLRIADYRILPSIDTSNTRESMNHNFFFDGNNHLGFDTHTSETVSNFDSTARSKYTLPSNPSAIHFDPFYFRNFSERKNNSAGKNTRNENTLTSLPRLIAPLRPSRYLNAAQRTSAHLSEHGNDSVNEFPNRSQSSNDRVVTPPNESLTPLPDFSRFSPRHITSIENSPNLDHYLEWTHNRDEINLPIPSASLLYESLSHPRTQGENFILMNFEPQQPKGLDSRLLDVMPIESFDPSIHTNELFRTCGICSMEYEQNDNLRRLPCLHAYHKDCIDQWLGEHTSCPLCRFDMNEAIHFMQ